MLMHILKFSLLFAFMHIATAAETNHTPQSAEAMIISVIQTQWQQPNQPVYVPIVAISTPFAVADWIQDARGGRALLKLVDGHWQTLACGDAQIKNVFTLGKMGVPKSHAEVIVQKLNLNEVHLSKAQLALINSFSGVVNVEMHSHHHE
jgi:hypothetical protein